MRDLPRAETSYPMCLAETASIFFETVVAADLLARAQTSEEKFAIAYSNAESAGVFMLNIPARFKFEYDLYTRRSVGKLSKSEIDTLMVDAWKHYYGPSLERLDEVGIFSATKLHFSISGLSFYNFPYSFGYLFSLSVYAARGRLGPKFADVYTGLLRDTGRMTAEEVVAKWLDGDITQKKFWEGGVALVKSQVEEFEQFSAEIGYVVGAADS
jgi:oligoendopeptidase F